MVYISGHLSSVCKSIFVIFVNDISFERTIQSSNIHSICLKVLGVINQTLQNLFLRKKKCLNYLFKIIYLYNSSVFYGAIN